MAAEIGHTDQLSMVFSALADPTRRTILQKVREQGCSVAEIAGMFDMSLPAVSKHLKVLTAAGLLTRERDGKFIICRYDPAPCREALQWITEQQRFWNDGLAALETFLDNDTK